MAMDLNTTWKNSFPVFTNDCLSIDITLAPATVTPLLPAIQAACGLLSLQNRSPKMVWIIGGRGVTDALIGTSANITFPLQHLPAAGNTHPEPFKFIFSEDRGFSAFDGPALISAAGGTIHCLVWA